MAVIINASTSTGLVQSADTSGQINIQSNGTTVLGVTSTGTSVTGTQSVSGNLSFNSGYGSSAVAYGCRAWVNFNGTGTPAIRASGNVSSITDNGTGDYTVNFTTAMPDANYATNLSIGSISGGSSDVIPLLSTLSTTSVRVLSVQAVFRDPATVCVSIFR
jgi:hypothetical protein